jgi:hypothetical protein
MDLLTISFGIIVITSFAVYFTIQYESRKINELLDNSDRLHKEFMTAHFKAQAQTKRNITMPQPPQKKSHLKIVK